MLAVCSALAYVTELSDSTLAATAAFTGAARFALMSDIAARSGSASPASSSSSSRLSLRYSTFSVMPDLLALVRLVDVDVLSGVRVRDRVVARDVECHGGV